MPDRPLYTVHRGEVPLLPSPLCFLAAAKLPTPRHRHYVFTVQSSSATEAVFPYPVAELPVFRGETFVIWQHERAGRDHIQGYVCLQHPTSLASFIAAHPGMHVEPRRGTHAQAAAYASKGDTRVSGPYSRGVPPAGAGQRADLSALKEAIAGGATRRTLLEDHSEVVAKYPRFVAEYLKLHAQTAVAKIQTLEPKFDFQRQILRIIDEPAHPRTIYWIYDPIGNHGKTYLCTYLVDSKGAYYSNGGKAVDLLYGYEGEGIVLFDYVRDSAEYVNYGVIEQLKNGILFSSKYESGLKRFNVPHVFVFSNFMPNLEKFSRDRLITWELDSVGVTI